MLSKMFKFFCLILQTTELTLLKETNVRQQQFLTGKLLLHYFTYQMIYMGNFNKMLLNVYIKKSN